MNKIVREHYPVSKLPEDLRAELGSALSVRVTVEAEVRQTQTTRAVLETAARLRREGKIKPVTTEEAVARIRALRDDWD